MDKLSIVIPVYNGAGHLEETLEHVFGSRFPDYEVIVIDDGSTDATPQILSSCRDSRLKIVRHEKNQGVSRSRNEGAEIARSELLLFLDSDVLIPPGLLGEVCEFMRANPGLAACQGRYSAHSYYRDPFSMYKNAILAFRGFEASHQDIHYIHTACAAIQKSVFLQFR